MKSFLNALSGGYIEPSSGGDAVANPNAVPTGRNMYSINAEATPSGIAWDRGVALANTTIENYKKKHGKYPQKVAYTFWSSEFVETEERFYCPIHVYAWCETYQRPVWTGIGYKIDSIQRIGQTQNKHRNPNIRAISVIWELPDYS